jgi:hypothetical protein
MSLINEALKKAQRDRHLDSLPPMPGGGGHPRRGRGLSTQTIILIASGVAALFVLSVVGTVFLINRTPSSKTGAVKAPAKPAADATAGTPMIVVPLAKPSPVPVAATPVPTPTPTSPPVAMVPVAAPVREAPPAAPSNVVSLNLGASRSPSVSEKFDQRVQTLVDSWHVTMVRPLGDDSKLFMNGSVYRIDDVIDRTSGLRLTKVSTTTLTFTDAAGMTYVKRY